METLNYENWLIKMSGVDELLEDNEFNKKQYLNYVKENMKTPKEKAIELIGEFGVNSNDTTLPLLKETDQIRLAIVCVQQIKNFNNYLITSFEKHSYWNKVTIELTKLFVIAEKKEKLKNIK